MLSILRCTSLTGTVIDIDTDIFLIAPLCLYRVIILGSWQPSEYKCTRET